ncbi:MAG: polysaccharide biosynthesis tyrosine autokinase [Acidimicrobiia bacterium]
MPVDPEPRTLELRDYFRVIRRFKWTIAVTVVLCVAAALALSFRETPKYRAAARLITTPDLSESLFTQGLNPSGGGGPNQVSARAIATEIQVMSSPRVVEAVTEELGRDPGDVGFSSISDTDIIQILVESTDAERAAETANAYASTYIDLRKEEDVNELLDAIETVQVEIDALTSRIDPIAADLAANPPIVVEGPARTTDPRELEFARLDSQRSTFIAQIDSFQRAITATQQGGPEVLAEAEVPESPINKTPVRNGVAGLALGVLLGVALAFLREYLDDSVKTKEDLERASGLTVVGLIPELPDWKNRKATPLIALSQPRSHASEAYRTVRTSLEFLGLEHPISSVQVTSALAAEGKTTTLSNLAATFAKGGQRVIVLCCDLRRPRVHEFFGLDNRVGFTSVLLGETPLSDAIQDVASEAVPLRLVASGPLPPNPAELLSSNRAASVIEALHERCDLLLIDSPPVVPVTDALVLAGLVDAVLLVGDSGSTTKRSLARAVELLRQVDAPLVGAVLNGVGARTEYGYEYGKDYYAYHAEPTSKRSRARATANGGGRGSKRTRVPS